MSSRRAALALALLVGALARPARAGDEMLELSLEALLRMPTTSATGGLALESDVVPANVITISRDDIRAHGWHSLAEVLAHVPGLHVIDDLVLPAVSVRGISGGLRSGSRILKIMINGVEVSFRPDLTAMLGPEYIPLVAVERIEIARGPLSALYGANAFLATVNVVTRSDELPTGELALRGSLRSEDPPGGAQHPSGGVSALAAASRARWKLLLAGNYDRIDRSGLRIGRTFPGQAGPAYQPYFRDASARDLSRPLGLFAQASVRTGAGLSSLQGGLQRLDAFGEFQAESILTHQSRQGLGNFWSQLKHELELASSLSATLAAGYAQGAPIAAEARYLNANDNAHYRTELAYRAFDFKATLHWKSLERLQALLSFDGTHERHRGFHYTQTFVRPQPPRAVGDTVATRPPIEVTLANLAPSLQLIASPVADLHLIANGRLDFSTVFERQYSWRAGASYRVSRALVAKLITGRAFQAPSPVLLYGLPGFGAANSIVGSKSPGGEPLAPQTVQSGELVISALPSRHALIVGSVFLQKVDQKIEFLSNAVGYRARNRRTETDLGAELTLRGSFGRWQPHASATTHRVLETDETPGNIGTAPPHYPTYWAMLGLRVGVPELRLIANATVRQVGERGASQSNAFLNGRPYALPAYTLVDLVLATEPLPLITARAPTRFSLAARNLLHAKYHEPGFGGIDLPNRGRTLLLELHQSF